MLTGTGWRNNCHGPGHNMVLMLCPGHKIVFMLCLGHNIRKLSHFLIIILSLYFYIKIKIIMVDDKPKTIFNQNSNEIPKELTESEFESELSESEAIIFVDDKGSTVKTNLGEHSNGVNKKNEERKVKENNQVKEIIEELEKNELEINLSNFATIAKENPQRFLDCVLENLKSFNDCKIRKIKWPKNFSIKNDNFLINKMKNIENKLDGKSIFDKAFWSTICMKL
jgi:hypothetical protein